MARGVRRTAAGLKVGQSTSEKISLHGVTPVVQRAGAAQAAIGAQTGHLTAASLKVVLVAAGNGAGARTATGLAVGDTVRAVIDLTDETDVTASFEATVTVVNQIQQSATDLTGDKVLVVAAANSTTDIAALKTLVNELRAALVEKGIIKGAA